MFKRITFILFLVVSVQTQVYSACDPHTYNMKYPNPKTPGMIFIETEKFASVELAIKKARDLGVTLTEADLCYGFSAKWGTDRHIEKGSRVGFCQIELFGDLTYKGFKTFNKNTHPTDPLINPLPATVHSMRNEETRDIRDRSEGVNWPMEDCTVTPPKCVPGFAALRVSNLMGNLTTSGIINGDKTYIVQNWTCIKI